MFLFLSKYSFLYDSDMQVVPDFFSVNDDENISPEGKYNINSFLTF